MTLRLPARIYRVSAGIEFALFLGMKRWIQGLFILGRVAVVTLVLGVSTWSAGFSGGGCGTMCLASLRTNPMGSAFQPYYSLPFYPTSGYSYPMMAPSVGQMSYYSSPVVWRGPYAAPMYMPMGYSSYSSGYYPGSWSGIAY